MLTGMAQQDIQDRPLVVRVQVAGGLVSQG